MRRQRGGAVTVGPVAFVRISFEAVGEEILETLLRGRLAGSPALAQATGPIGMTGLEVPVLERLARNAGNSHQPLRCGQGRGHFTERLQPAPERGEDAQA